MKEPVSSAKFKTVFVGAKVPDNPGITELKHWCRIFHEKGLARPHKLGSFGNLSFRDTGTSFIITGSGVRFGDEWAENPFVRVVSCDMEKFEVYAEGLRDPSSESLLHDTIYRHRPEVNAVFHGHSRPILTCAGRLGLVQTRSEEPYGSASLARSIREVLDGGSFIVIRGHGFVSLGTTMKEAGELALEKLELARGLSDE